MSTISTYDPSTSTLRRWWVIVALGVGLSIIGILLLIDLTAAAFSLALLAGLGLLIAGFDEIAQADRHLVRWASYALGAVWVITGIWAVLWPGVALLVLGWVVGLGLLVGGVVAIVFALRYRRALPLWGIWLVDGAIGIGIGVIA